MSKQIGVKSINKKRVMEFLVFFVQILVLGGFVAASVFLLYRYILYGEGCQENSALQMDELGSGSAVKGDTGEEAELLERKDTGFSIRVQILGDDFQEAYHREVSVVSDGTITVQSPEGSRTTAGNEWSITAEELLEQSLAYEQEAADGKELTEPYCLILEAKMEPQKDEVQELVPLILRGLQRAEEDPAYSGKLYLYPAEQGILVVNEVPLETYLCSVVSSEMPSDYPEEALKAQAVCARTYAVNCMKQQKNEKYEIHLDDSVSFQVYNNYQKNEASAEAVGTTEGVVLNCEDVRYYSTSCQTEGRTDLGTEEQFRDFLEKVPESGAEYGSPWIRWSVEIGGDVILQALQESCGCSWDQLDQIQVSSRNPDGQVTGLEFACKDEQLQVEGEYMVRKVLTPRASLVKLLDGSGVEGMVLLPSAYFSLEIKSVRKKAETDGITAEINGGGYGHGVGMSQYGAAEMAATGADYQEILSFYYGE